MNLADTDEECHCRSDGGGKPNRKTESAFHPSQMKSRPHSLCGMPHKSFLLAVLSSEGLDNADRAKHLLHDGKSGTVIGLCFPGATAQSPPIDLRNHIKDRRYEERDQSQLPVDSRGNVKHSCQCQARLDERHQVIDRYCLDRNCVGLNAIEGIHGSLGIVIGQGQALDLTEKFRAELEQEFFPGVGLEQ